MHAEIATGRQSSLPSDNFPICTLPFSDPHPSLPSSTSASLPPVLSLSSSLPRFIFSSRISRYPPLPPYVFKFCPHTFLFEPPLHLSIGRWSKSITKFVANHFTCPAARQSETLLAPGCGSHLSSFLYRERVEDAGGAWGRSRRGLGHSGRSSSRVRRYRSPSFRCEHCDGPWVLRDSITRLFKFSLSHALPEGKMFYCHDGEPTTTHDYFPLQRSLNQKENQDFGGFISWVSSYRHISCQM